MKKNKKTLINIFSNEKFQLLYGVSLIILVPIIIIMNAISIINRYNDTIDTSLQRRGLLIGRVFSSIIKDDLSNHEVLQRKIEEIHAASPDISDLKILIPSQEEFEIIASTDKNEIGNKINFFYYNLAWQQLLGEALATDSLILSSVNDEVNPDIFRQNDRFWLVSLPLADNERNKVALLSMSLSSQVIDDLTNATWKSSLFSLALSILVIILFLAVSTRLWGYVGLYRKVKEVDQMKDEFISMASHELRTPITSIKGYSSMVIDGSLGDVPEKIKPGIKRIFDSANRLGSLVEDLLNVSRIEQGRMDFELKPINPSPIIQSVINEVSVNSTKKSLQLTASLTKESALINIDPDKLKQILINIIGNAIKYTEKGSVTVTTSIIPQGLEIKVKDTGIGISIENQKNLFNKFYRIRNDVTRGIQGTGLGLWITKQLIETMKGKITIESIEGTGTQVRITFPLIKK